MSIATEKDPSAVILYPSMIYGLLELPLPVNEYPEKSESSHIDIGM